MHNANVIFREVKEMVHAEPDKKKRMKIVKRMMKMKVVAESCPMCHAGTVDIDGIHHECENGHFWFDIQEGITAIRKARNETFNGKQSVRNV